MMKKIKQKVTHQNVPKKGEKSLCLDQQGKPNEMIRNRYKKHLNIRLLMFYCLFIFSL